MNNTTADKLRELAKELRQIQYNVLSTHADETEEVIIELENVIDELDPKPEMWEPGEYPYNWFVESDGILDDSDVSLESDRLFGNESRTREVAETRRDVNRTNNLFASFAEECGEDGRFNKEKGQTYRCAPFYNNDGLFGAASSAHDDMQTVYMTLETCAELCRLINAKRFPVGGE